MKNIFISPPFLHLHWRQKNKHLKRVKVQKRFKPEQRGNEGTWERGKLGNREASTATYLQLGGGGGWSLDEWRSSSDLGDLSGSAPHLVLLERPSQRQVGVAGTQVATSPQTIISFLEEKKETRSRANSWILDQRRIILLRFILMN